MFLKRLKLTNYRKFSVEQNVVEFISSKIVKKQEDENAEEKCVAMALLPPEIQEGCHIAYEMMEYRMIK